MHRSGERNMPQLGIMNNKAANISTVWDSDDELSGRPNEEDAVTQLSSSISPAASSIFIPRENKDEDKSDDESSGTTSTQDTTACDVINRKRNNVNILQACANR